MKWSKWAIFFLRRGIEVLGLCRDIGFDKKNRCSLGWCWGLSQTFIWNLSDFYRHRYQKPVSYMPHYFGVFFLCSLYFILTPSPKLCNKNRASHLRNECMLPNFPLYDGCYTKRVVQCIFLCFFAFFYSCLSGNSCRCLWFSSQFDRCLSLCVLFIVIHSDEYG